jgi:hypothetical protein
MDGYYSFIHSTRMENWGGKLFGEEERAGGGRRFCGSRLVVESLMLVGLGRVWTLQAGADCMGPAPIRSK